MIQMTEPDFPSAAGPSNLDELPSYAAQSTGTPPPPSTYRSHRRLVLWPAPFPTSPDPLFGVDVTPCLPSTDEFGAEEILAIGPACVCDECGVRLLEDKKGARVHGRITFQGHGGVVWVWDAREGCKAGDELHRWPQQGTGPLGGVWRLSPSHEVVGLVSTPEGLHEWRGESSSTVDIDADHLALGDGGGVCVALARGAVAFWRDREPVYLHAPAKLPIESGEGGWVRWTRPTRSLGEGDLVTDVVCIAAGEVAVALRRNGEVWVAADHWYLLCTVTKPETVGLAAAGPLVALYRTSSCSAPAVVAYIVHTLRRQVHPVRVDDGVLELALRPLNVPARPTHTSAPERKIPFGDARRKLSLVLGGRDDVSRGPQPTSSASLPSSEHETLATSERKLSLDVHSFTGKSKLESVGRREKNRKNGKTQEARLSHSTLRFASVPALSTTPADAVASRGPYLSLVGYEASLRTASGHVYAWNMRWPVLNPLTPAGSSSESEGNEEGMTELPAMDAQAVRLPPGERDSTLFPISVGVRSALCVTVGEADDPGFKDKVRRAWKGMGRVPITGPMATHGAFGL